MGKATIRDVARAAKVSVGTASMALNGKPNVNAETRDRILKLAQEMNYNPSPFAQYLTSNHTNMVGVIVTDTTNPFFGTMIDCLQRNLGAHGYDMMLGISRGDMEEEKALINKFVSMKVCGIIVVPSHGPVTDTSHYTHMSEAGTAICFITSYYPGIDGSCVMTDLSDGSYQLTKHLLSSGHHRIVYLTGDTASPVSSLRIEGYLSAYREFGIDPDPRWVVSTDVTLSGAYLAGEQLIHLLPDAILTINDFMALGVIRYLKEQQIRVPEEISVAGYDDLVYSSMLETPLTTVRQPLEQICMRTVELLMRQCEQKEPCSEKILLKPSLIIRNSTR